MNTDEMDGNSLFGWLQRLAYTQTIGKVDITAAAVHYRNALQSGNNVNTLLADASVVWRLKKVRLSAEVRNLFNKRRYTVTTYSGVMSSTDWYEPAPEGGGSWCTGEVVGNLKVHPNQPKALPNLTECPHDLPKGRGWVCFLQ